MAVDSASKRSSAVHMMLPWRTQIPLPFGVITAAARATLALLYSGFFAGSGAGGAGSWLVLARRRFRR